MRILRVVALAAGLAIPSTVIAQQDKAAPVPSAPVVSSTSRVEVQQVVRAYVEAWNKADASELAESYSREPGVTSVGDGEIIRGWDRIRERLDSLSGMAGRFNVAIGSVDVVPMGPGSALALTSYTLTLHGPAGDVQRRGAMTLALQKVGAEWKVVHDHTSTLPTRAEAAAAPPAPPGAPLPSPAPNIPAPAALTIPVANGQAVEIAATQFADYTFQLPAAACVISGRVTGISGGGKDFEALIMDDDNFRNWKSGHPARAYWQSGRVVVTNITDASVQGPGSFHFVLSNVFSVLSPKTVQAQAMARCAR